MLTSGKMINGSPAIFINTDHQFSPTFELPITMGQAQWMRVTNTFCCKEKEWIFWLMPQVIVKFFEGDIVVKEKMYRPQRLMKENEIKSL